MNVASLLKTFIRTLLSFDKTKEAIDRESANKERSELTKSETISLASQLNPKPRTLPQNLEQEIRAQRKFSLAEVISREGGNFMKGESAIPRPLQAATEINQFIATHLPNPTGALSTTLQSWAKEDIRVSRHLDTPLIALAQIIKSLLSEPTTFQEFFRQLAIAQSHLTGDRPHFQKAGQAPHPDADYACGSVRSQLKALLQKIEEISD